MRTSKTISTISYNSPAFLRAKIEEWKKCGLIEFGAWIYHHPEADEKKGHYHVMLRPAKMVQTLDLENDSMELDPNNLDKPFKMIGFRVSKEADWLLYSIHDRFYLAEKGLEKSFNYDFSDIQSTDDDTLFDIITHSSDDRKGKLEYRLRDLARQGKSWTEIVASGFIPLRFMAGAKLMYEALPKNDDYYTKS